MEHTEKAEGPPPDGSTETKNSYCGQAPGQCVIFGDQLGTHLVFLESARVVSQRKRGRLEEGLDVFVPVRLLRTVGREAQCLPEDHCGVLREERAHGLHLLRADPAGQRSELVCAFFRVFGGLAVV